MDRGRSSAPRFSETRGLCLSCYSASPQTMDVRDMRDIPNGSFEYAIDKGTMDSLLCGANSTQNVYKYLCEVGIPTHKSF